MWIRRFEVSGFKNFVEPVVLDDLGPINVIHGDNNIGKSNLLDAMDLFFAIVDGNWLPTTFSFEPQTYHPAELEHLGHPQEHDGFLQSTGIRVEAFADPDARHFARRVFETVGDDASQAAGRDWLLVTDDTGWEFHGLARLTTWKTLMAALDRIG